MSRLTNRNVAEAIINSTSFYLSTFIGVRDDVPAHIAMKGLHVNHRWKEFLKTTIDSFARNICLYMKTDDKPRLYNEIAEMIVLIHTRHKDLLGVDGPDIVLGVAESLLSMANYRFDGDPTRHDVFCGEAADLVRASDLAGIRNLFGQNFYKK